MLEVICLKRFKNENGIITHYTLQVNPFEKRTVTAEALKNAIRNREVNCANLVLTSDNRLIERKEKFDKIENIDRISNPQYDIVQNRLKLLEMYKTYINKLRVLGVKSDAEYSICDDRVILDKVLVKNGTFVIQPFVSAIDITNGDGFIKPYISQAFQECERIKLINKSNITDFENFFIGCDKLVELDLSEFDTSKATTMKRIFALCKNLREINLSNFNTSKVKDMSYMFCGCQRLQKINISSFDTSKVEKMDGMFVCCQSLKEIDISTFDISNVKSMFRMFDTCSNLEYINFGKLSIPKSVDVRTMFYRCEGIDKQTLSKFSKDQQRVLFEDFSN